MLSEEDKKLCALVKQHPQLYDESHKDYGQQKATVEASDNENLANEYFIKFILCHMLNMTPREQSIFRIRIWQNACKILEDGSSASSDDNDDLRKTMLLKIDTASEQELHDLEEKILLQRY
uniref:8-hydroxyquercetin 8-O-methyltransferase n=1 Tax=Zeugodacus cucurbitae TaxID=28588 RepID=A0A0A1XLK2_ZEUCU